MSKLSGHFYWGPGERLTPYSSATHQMNSGSATVGSVFAVPKDGVLSKIGVNVGSVIGNPPPYDLYFCTLDASGHITTNKYGGCAAKSFDFTDAMYYWVELDTPAQASAGDIIAAILVPGDPAPSSGNNINLTIFTIYPNSTVPRSELNGTNYAAYFSLGAMYSDGSIALPSVWWGGYTINSGSNPNEVGARFQIPFNAKCVGCRIPIVGTNAGADYFVNMYDPSGGSLVSLPVDQSQYVGKTTVALVDYRWDPVSLAKSANYRLTIQCRTINNIYIPLPYFNEAESREYWPTGQYWERTHRQDIGDWSQSTTQMPPFALILSEIDLGGEHAAGMMIG